MLRLPRLAAAILAAGLCCIDGAAAAERSAKHILVVSSQDTEPYSLAIEGFRETLVRTGGPMAFETVVLGADPSTAGRALKERRHDPDLCLTLGSPALGAVAAAGLDAPIVAGLVLKEPENKRSGGAAASVTLAFPLEKQLELVRKVLPQARVAGVIYNPEENGRLVEEAVAISAGLGLEILPVGIRAPRDIPQALASVARKADVLWGIPDAMVMSPETAREIILFSIKNRVPLAGLSPPWVKAGALFSPAWDYRDLGRQCADIAAALLQGKGGNERISSGPERMLYTLNARTARRLKVPLAPDLRKHALEVY